MKKFNLYFAGRSYDLVDQHAKDIGANKLFTQVGERKPIISWAEDKINGIIKNKLFVDSGAFTAHTQGHGVDVDDYIDFVNKYDDGITLFAQVDKIPGTFGMPRTEEEILKAPEESWENYLYMRPLVNSPEKLVPIFHQDEDFKWLRNMLSWTDENGKHIPYIGISSSKDKPPKFREAWYWKVFAEIQSSPNPNVDTHSFGTSSIRHLELFPFTSSDATSWIRTAAFGEIYTKFGQVVVSDVKLNRKDHVRSCKYSNDVMEEYVASYGYKLDDLIYDNEEGTAAMRRAMFNLDFLVEFEKNYVYKGPKSFIQKGLF